MIKDNLQFKYLSVFKKCFLNKILVLGLFLIFMISSLSTAYPQTHYIVKREGKAIVWDVLLNFHEPGGASDQSIFGEAPDARDGPPADAYDTVKPPLPMAPFIRVWFNDSIPYPYDELWEDYRYYPETSKIWNLTVQWVPSDYASSTMITITWNQSRVANSEYNVVNLCTNTGIPLKNMLLTNTYVFNCLALTLHYFKIICLTNQAPGIPSNPSPSNGSIAVLVNTNLSWTCSDPNGDPLTYDVYFGTSSPPPKIASNITASTYDPGTMNMGTLYYWKIVAWDIYRAFRVGPIWYFQTNRVPNQPNIPSPSNGSTGVLINADMSWSGGDPDGGDTVTYDVYFGSSSSPPHVGFNQSGLVYDPGTLMYTTLYYWRIIAWDNHGAMRVGPLWHFTTGTQPNQAPNIPNTPSPANGSTGVSINADLSWKGGDPDAGDTVTYDVYFGTSSSPPIVIYNQSGLSYDPGALSSNTYYYWKIVAWDNQGATTKGPLWHFRTADIPNQPPYAPCNPNPVDGATEVPVNSDLSWSCNDPDVGDFITFDVYFGSMFPLTKIKSNISGTSCMLDNLNYSTKYYWKVIAWDNHQNMNTSPLWSFTTKLDTTGPSLAITSPKKGYFYMNLLAGNIQRVFPIFITTLVIGQVDIIATASDSQSGVNRVEIFIDDVLKINDTSAPYSWIWSDRGYFFPYDITVTAYDNVGKSSSLSMRVWKIL